MSSVWGGREARDGTVKSTKNPGRFTCNLSDLTEKSNYLFVDQRSGCSNILMAYKCSNLAWKIPKEYFETLEKNENEKYALSFMLTWHFCRC